MESLNLEIEHLREYTAFTTLLNGFPNMKSLELRLSVSPAKQHFPFEELIHMPCLENLVILLPYFDKPRTLDILPKFPSLAQIKIGLSIGSWLSIELDDYNSRFKLNK